MDPPDKDTKHIKDQSTVTEGYLEYTKENEKCKVNQLDVGNKKNQHNVQCQSGVNTNSNDNNNDKRYL